MSVLVDSELALLSEARRIADEVASRGGGRGRSRRALPASRRSTRCAPPARFRPGCPRRSAAGVARSRRSRAAASSSPAGCSSTAMVFAMHQIQVLTIARHRDEAPWFEGYLRDLAREQRLVASVTSEVGTGGDMARSIAPVTPAADGSMTFEKQATDRQLRRARRRSLHDRAPLRRSRGERPGARAHALGPASARADRRLGHTGDARDLLAGVRRTRAVRGGAGARRAVCGGDEPVAGAALARAVVARVAGHGDRGLRARTRVRARQRPPAPGTTGSGGAAALARDDGADTAARRGRPGAR